VAGTGLGLCPQVDFDTNAGEHAGSDEVLSGYQPGQMVERWKKQRFEDHLCLRPQGTSLSPLNHLTRLIENFIILSRRKSNKSHVSSATKELDSHSVDTNVSMCIECH